MTSARRQVLLDALDRLVAAQTLLIDASVDREEPWARAALAAARTCKEPIAIVRAELGLDARTGEGE